MVAAQKPDLSYLLGHFEEIFGGNVHATMADLFVFVFFHRGTVGTRNSRHRAKEEQ